VIEKQAEGPDYLIAKRKAEAIHYNYNLSGNTLTLDAFLTTDFENKYRDQEVEVVVYLPVGTILYADDNTYSFHRNDYNYRDILNNGDEEKYLIIEDGKTRCIDCPIEEKESWEKDVEKKHNGNKESWEKEVENDFNPVKKKDSISNTIVLDTIE